MRSIKLILLVSLLGFVVLMQTHASASEMIDVTQTTVSMADQGYSEAQSKLGFMYYRGEGVPKDYKLAFHWIEKSVHPINGDAKAKYSLGLKFYKGEGVPKNHKQAFYWFEKSAQQGYAAAQYFLKSEHYNIEDSRKVYKQSFYTMHANRHYLLRDFMLENSDVQGLLRVVD